MIDSDIIENLKKHALLSNIKNNRHAAAILVSGNGICMSYNKQFSMYNTVHAEISVIKEFIAKTKIKSKLLIKIDIIVIRFSNNTLKNSKPCFACINQMKKLGIRKVFYSNSDNIIVCENVQDMENTHISSLNRFKIKSGIR